MTAGHDDPKGARTAASVDWAPQDAYPPATVHCRCGTSYRSHVKGQLVPRLTISRKACPGCESHIDGYRVEMGPETVTIRG